MQNQNFQKNEKNLQRHYHFTHVWFLRNRLWWTEYFVILDNFLLFYPTNNLENPIFEIMKKKTTGDIIILQMCTTNDNHVWFLRYGVWQAEFFVILDHFLPFYFPNNPKYQNFEKMKKRLEISKVYQKAWSYATMFQRYSAWRM